MLIKFNLPSYLLSGENFSRIHTIHLFNCFHLRRFVHIYTIFYFVKVFYPHSVFVYVSIVSLVFFYFIFFYPCF